MSDKIKIHKVTGGQHKDDLKGCYFLPSSTISGAYDFYDTNNNVLESGVSGGSDFSFPLSGYSWRILNLVISLTAASGDWRNNAGGIEEEEDGTFQAQAGGGADPAEKDATAASA